MNRSIITTKQAIRDLQNGKMIIMCDHPARENEGDFVIAAEYATIENINTMISIGKGLVCCPLVEERARSLQLPPQCAQNRALHGTQFTVSIDATTCSGSGISVLDRVHTIRALANPASAHDDFVRPGHIFPLVSHPDGLHGREGHTEATCALLELGGLQPVGVICEIIAEHGAMANQTELETLAHSLDIGIIHIDTIKRHIDLLPSSS